MKTEEARPDETSLVAMRASGLAGEWYAYRNADLGSRDCGHLKFLCCGAARTFVEPPPRLPDTPTQINWRYVLCGKVNLDTGDIEPLTRKGEAVW